MGKDCPIYNDIIDDVEEVIPHLQHCSAAYLTKKGLLYICLNPQYAGNFLLCFNFLLLFAFIL